MSFFALLVGLELKQLDTKPLCIDIAICTEQLSSEILLNVFGRGLPTVLIFQSIEH